MNNKNAILIGLTVISIVVAVYLYSENIKKTLENDKLKEDNLKLILDSLKQNKNLSVELKRQLENLMRDFKNVDKKVSSELAQALQLVQIGQPEKAILDLVKIIEHLLTLHYKENKSFTDWLKNEKKKNDLHNLLTFCKQDKKISEIEFQFFLSIKTIRNKEAHTVDLNLDKYLSAAGLITAIGAIFKISSFVFPKNAIIS